MSWLGRSPTAAQMFRAPTALRPEGLHAAQSHVVHRAAGNRSVDSSAFTCGLSLTLLLYFSVTINAAGFQSLCSPNGWGGDRSGVILAHRERSSVGSFGSNFRRGDAPPVLPLKYGAPFERPVCHEIAEARATVITRMIAECVSAMHVISFCPSHERLHPGGKLAVLAAARFSWDRSLIRQRFRSRERQRSGVLFPTRR